MSQLQAMLSSTKGYLQLLHMAVEVQSTQPVAQLLQLGTAASRNSPSEQLQKPYRSTKEGMQKMQLLIVVHSEHPCAQAVHLPGLVKRSKLTLQVRQRAKLVQMLQLGEQLTQAAMFWKKAGAQLQTPAPLLTKVDRQVRQRVSEEQVWQPLGQGLQVRPTLKVAG